jgi:hypothetical protein
MSVVDYLRNTIGLRVEDSKIPEQEKKKLPLYLRNIPDMAITINGIQAILEFKRSLDETTPDIMEKQKEILQQRYGCLVIFCFDKLKAFERKRLIERNFDFIVEGKQIYIPSLMMNIQDYNTARMEKAQDKLSPAAQYLLLYHLQVASLHNMAFNSIPKYLKYYTPMSVSRAARKLEDKGLCAIEGSKPKFFRFHDKGRELWDVALPFLSSPVKKKLFTHTQPLMNRLMHAGDSALAHYTDLNDTGELCIALSEKQLKEHGKNFNLFPSKFGGSVCIEVWKYPPELLTKENNYVDPLSLYLCYKDDTDERVQKALQQLLGKVQWSEG